MKERTAGLRSGTRVLLTLCLSALGIGTFASESLAMKCGPHMLTYSVHALDGTTGLGIRRLKVISHTPGSLTGEFIWYGEGRWGNDFRYRHVGTGYTNLGDFQSLAMAADITGNGETSNGVSMNLSPAVTDGTWPAPKEIRITGGWGEFWRLADDVAYDPLPMPNQCGHHFSSYRVRDLAGTRSGDGFRCVTNLGFGDYRVFFGTGNWGGHRYTNIGSFSLLPPDSRSGTGQASDMCDPHFGPNCVDFHASSISFDPSPEGYRVTGAWSETWNQPGRLAVVTLNVGGMWINEDVTWKMRADRFTDWLRTHKVVPDVIALQEVWGWMYTPPTRSCGLGFAVGAGDYDQVDILLASLRDAVGVTYRVAYHTGKKSRMGEIAIAMCDGYQAHAVLYNPARLQNLTAQSASNTAHDAEDNLSGVPHLRRSLPLCNRGTNLMPLEVLIDGLPQTDKCNRPTPSGPAWAVFQPTGHIAASYVRFAFRGDPGKAIDFFNMHPTAGHEFVDRPHIQQLITMHTPPPYAGSQLYYPPIMAGDLNILSPEEHFPPFIQLYASPIDPLTLVGIANPDLVPSQFLPRVADRMQIPDLPPNTPYCETLVHKRVSDHCGVFVQFEWDGADAGRLRRVFIDGPTSVSTGKPYRLVATPSGGGDLVYQWSPGGPASPQLDAQAGAPGTVQNWTVTVTDTKTRLTTSAQRSVRAVRDISECRAECADLRDRCQTCQGVGCRIPAALCMGRFNQCLGRCDSQ